MPGLPDGYEEERRDKTLDCEPLPPISIPVVMVEYMDKQYLTDKAPVVLKLVDPDKRIPLVTWPNRALSLTEVPNDVHTDRLCVSNVVLQALHRIQHELTAVGSTMFDVGVWGKSELEEALAANSWVGRQHKEYSWRELVSAAQNINNIKHPSGTK